MLILTLEPDTVGLLTDSDRTLTSVTVTGPPG